MMSSSQGPPPQEDEERSSAAEDADEVPRADSPVPGSENAPDNEGTSCISRDVYIDSGNEKKILYVLCVGVKCEDDQPLFSLEREPWSLLPGNSTLRPRNADL